MRVDVRSTSGHGILSAHVAFQPLTHVSTLSDVDRNPGPILALGCINEIAGHWLERSANGIDLILILLAGLAGPIHQRRRGAPGLGVMAK